MKESTYAPNRKIPSYKLVIEFAKWLLVPADFAAFVLLMLKFIGIYDAGLYVIITPIIIRAFLYSIEEVICICKSWVTVSKRYSQQKHAT